MLSFTSTNVLSQSVAMPDGLPQKMVTDAQGIAIVPNMVRGAFVVGLQHGRVRGTLKVGVDASAAAGPVGRQASAATDLAMKAEILSYSRARGTFVGASIQAFKVTRVPE